MLTNEGKRYTILQALWGFKLKRVIFIIGMIIIGWFLGSCGTTKNKTEKQLFSTDNPYFYEIFEISIEGYNSVPRPVDETFNNLKTYRNTLYTFTTGDNYFCSGATSQADLYSSLTENLPSYFVNTVISYVNTKGNICLTSIHPSDSNKRNVLYVEKLEAPLIIGNIWYDLPQLQLLKMGMAEEDIKKIHKNMQVSEVYADGKIRYVIGTTPVSIFAIVVDPINGLETFSFYNTNYKEEDVLGELTSLFGKPIIKNNTYNFFENLPKNIKIITFTANRNVVVIIYTYENAIK
jgi:hypothetical protein